MSNVDLLNTFAAAYPAQPATAYWRAIEIGAIVRHGLPGGLGLDLGCGDGILTDILLTHAGARRLVGIDPDPLEALAAKKYSFYERVHVSSGTAIPEQDETFDFVLANSVLEHIPELDATLGEVSRVLRTGGKFIFTVPAPGFHRNLRGPVVPWVSREGYLQTLDRRIAHYHYYSSMDWAAAAERHGMIVDACLGYLDKHETRRWETLSRFTGGLFYSFFGQTRRPIEIQRSLGIRAFQNSSGLPQPLASCIARIINIGASVDRNNDVWVEEDRASCLLVVGQKNKKVV